jgi:monovalent cation/hydrogen antiporter
LPPRLLTLIGREGLLNDATALTTCQVAVAATVGGGFSLAVAAGQFVLAAGGGLLIGVAIGYLQRLARPVLRDPLIANAVSLATPFAAYVAGEAAHVSGVLAGLRDEAPGVTAAAIVVTLAAVLLVRPLWLFGTQVVPGFLGWQLGDRNPPLNWREALALTWAGTRGVITLAADSRFR